MGQLSFAQSAATKDPYYMSLMLCFPTAEKGQSTLMTRVAQHICRVLLLTCSICLLGRAQECSTELDALKLKTNEQFTNLDQLLDIPTWSNFYLRGLGTYVIGRIRTPRLLAVNLDIENLLAGVNPNGYEIYIGKMWELALYALAAEYANTVVPDYGEAVKQLTLDVATSGVLELSQAPSLRSKAMNTLSSQFKERILIPSRAFRGIQARTDFALERFAGVVNGLVAASDGFGQLMQWGQLERAEQVAKGTIDVILLEEIIPQIKQTTLYANDRILRQVIANAEQISSRYFNEERLRLVKTTAGTAVTLLATINPPTIAGSTAGPAGTLVGFAVGVSIATGLFLWQEGEIYLIGYNTSSLLYSLSYSFAAKRTRAPEDVLLMANCIQSANRTMEEKVVGKMGKLILLHVTNQWPTMLEDIIETARWQNYLDAYFSKTRLLFLTLTSGKGLLVHSVDGYLECLHRVQKLRTIQTTIVRAPYLPLLMWVCSVVAFLLAVRFIIQIVGAISALSLFQGIRAIRDLAAGLLAEAITLAAFWFFLVGGSLGDNFRATLGMMSAKTIQSVSYISKEMFGKEMFVNESIDAMYLVCEILNQKDH